MAFDQRTNLAITTLNLPEIDFSTWIARIFGRTYNPDLEFASRTGCSPLGFCCLVIFACTFQCVLGDGGIACGCQENR